MLVPIRSILFSTLAVAFLGATGPGQRDTTFPPLSTEMTAGWRQYVAATEQRIERELTETTKFLALDFGASAVADRQAVLSGKMPVAPTRTQGPKGQVLEVPDAWVHHWRGAVLVRGVRLDQVFERLQAEVPGVGKGDVVEARIDRRDGPRMRTFIRLQRSGDFLWWSYRFVYKTEHDVVFTRRDGSRGTSTSTATKIAELYEPGTSKERELRAGEDNRLLQRWNSYWRYEEVPAGVIVECESLTLSRSGLLGMGRGVADGTAKESMEKALVNLRGHFATAGRTRPGLSPAR